MDITVKPVSEEELRAAAKKDLKTCLAQSVIPEQFWPEIIEWLEISGNKEMFLEGTDAIGAWWAYKEAKNMGFELNFTKAGYLPNTWYPEGDTWKEAQANAKLKLVEAWGILTNNGALTILPKEEALDE